MEVVKIKKKQKTESYETPPPTRTPADLLRNRAQVQQVISANGYGSIRYGFCSGNG
jgi:hypothetical protein